MLLSGGSSFVGCSNKNENIIVDNKNNEFVNNVQTPTTNEEEQYISFLAKVIEKNDNNFLVEPLANTNEAKSSDLISVGINNVKDIPKDIEENDYIEIFYNGLILESYPAQIQAYKIKTTDNKYILIKQLEVIEMKDNGFLALGTQYGDENNNYYITLENISNIEIKLNDYIEIYYIEDTTIKNENEFQISPIDIKILNYCPIKDPQAYKQLMFVEDTLYENTGNIVNFVKCGTLDGEIIEVIPFREIPSINGTANFKTTGYQRVNENYIVVPINNQWYYFAKSGNPILNDYTFSYSMMVTSNVMGDIKEIPIIPVLSLNEIDKTFTFCYDPLSSYLPYGTYEIKNNNIVCTTIDKEKVFVFTFYENEDIIHFNEKESTPIEYVDENIRVEIKNGSTFFSNR